MNAFEIEAPIINHRIDISSELLPESAARARVIVLYDEQDTRPELETADIISLARAAQASFPKVDPRALQQDLVALREEWERGL